MRTGHSQHVIGAGLVKFLSFIEYNFCIGGEIIEKLLDIWVVARNLGEKIVQLVLIDLSHVCDRIMAGQQQVSLVICEINHEAGNLAGGHF